MIFKDHLSTTADIILGKSHKIEEFIIVMFFRRGRHSMPGGDIMGSMLESWPNQAGGALGESKHPRASAFIRVRVGYTSTRCEGISLIHLNVTRSQSVKNRKGICGRDQHYHAAVAGHFDRVLVSYSWGYCSIRKIPRFENL